MEQSPNDKLQAMIRERNNLDATIAEAQATAKTDAIQSIKDLVTINDLTQDEVVKAAFPGNRGRKPKGTAANGVTTRVAAEPKYQNPSDTTQTWTGKGRQPNWFKELVAGGTDPETLLIA
jgi:DNA-binding protein H-NS